ncbi:hypothetical protein EalM132_00086 [Exiguobacterium phage vB_EalM-132]|nr:hypothetical protein EalM132_00086 [Exiguobacterium phage vB_EalM-132]
MSKVDKSVAPYRDDYNPDKGYSHILAVPGRVEQAREFSQTQSMVYDYLQRLSDTLLRNGAIVSGMGFAVRTDTGTIIVEDGRVYMNGKIHNFKKQEIPMPMTGVANVGVKHIEELITETQDLTLLDPATSTGNYGQPGGHRIKNTIQLVVNDENASSIYDFVDGLLQSEVPRPQFDGLNDLLARRTYDESGNYRVRGLELSTEPHDANNMRVVVESGTAYVRGYQVIKPTPVKAVIPMSKDVRTVVGEPKLYQANTTRYKLNNVPAKTISQITAHVQVSQAMTRSSTPNGTDFLANTPVVQIMSVTSGGTTYTQGTDYQLTNDGVDWSLGGAEPTSGASYSVTYRFNKTLVQGTDYRLFQEIGQFGDTIDYVEFLAGDRPASDTTFYVTYDFYLARMDIVSISKSGEIIVTRGQSDIPRNVIAPIVDNPDLLPLGAVFLPPNTGVGKATFNTTTRLEMAKLQKMAQQIDDIEFNQAITALDREAMSGEVATDLRGIFSDSFRSTVRADLTHPQFNVMYDLAMGNLMMPTASTKANKPAISNPGSVKQFTRLVTAPMVEVVALSQMYATTTMLVNPYLAFNSLGVLNLNPQVDNWIEESYIKIEETEFEARNFYRWWNHPEHVSRVDDLFGLQIVEGAPVGTKVEDWRPKWQQNVFPSAVAVKTDKSTTILNEAITYMRQREVNIHATNLQPSTDRLECTFDGIRVALTPLAGYSAGSVAGTVRANSVGEVKAKFTVPANVKTGTREVKLTNASNTASTSYTALGTKQSTVDKIITTRISLTAIDPLAQTFQFERDTTLTSVGAYFSAKDNTHNVLVQIRNVVNGYPGTTILAEKVLTPGQINVSNNAATETKVTFDDPVLCSAGQQYAMVYLSDSDVHAMYVADLGQKDITTGVLVNRQPYLAGMLFSSSNGLAWTAHQSKNLKFKIYTAKFNASTTVDFGQHTSLSADRLLLIADAITPLGTTLTWQVSLDGGAYLPIREYSDLDLIKVAGTARLRALITTNGHMSPVFTLDGLQLISFTSATTGRYISRNVELAEPMTKVKQTYEAYIPSGCTVTPQFSYNNGSTWITPTQVSSEPISAEFTRFVCEATVLLSANAKNFRARLNITSNTPTARPIVRRFANVMK